MEHLKYIIEDSTIAELLGNQNFINKESAILELTKNAYDANAIKLTIKFEDDTITLEDNGDGMDSNDIRQKWMHVGKSDKGYEVVDSNNKKRILAGSKGIGRFALSRLGKKVSVCSLKKGTGNLGITWETEWNESTLTNDNTLEENGTKIIIVGLRDKWGKRAISDLSDFLSKTYNDDLMLINIEYNGEEKQVKKYIPEPKLGRNCLSNIKFSYDSASKVLTTQVLSDEFQTTAKALVKDIDIHKFKIKTNIYKEFINKTEWDLSTEDLDEYLKEVGCFSGELFFNVYSTRNEIEKFLYKYSSIPEGLDGGIILYRNAFSITSYEGDKDWLGLGKRSRKSPAAASHPTGAWRVRENQIAGKIDIDKKINKVLKDLSNRQGLVENTFYKLFKEIILTGLKEFERYRQAIIRSVNVKNEKESESESTPISDRVIHNPSSITELSNIEAKQLATELKTFQKEKKDYRREQSDTEKRYKYDVRILNVLATTGLKASSIAHEMHNDRNSIDKNYSNIVSALSEYGFWDELTSPDKTLFDFRNVPSLLESNRRVSKRIVAFMNTMLSEIEKKQFKASMLDINEILISIKNGWERDYAWISISVSINREILYLLSEDIIRVVLDNLILNSIQQNDQSNNLKINIVVEKTNNKLQFVYSDDGKGLDEKYANNPKKILEVHETTRKNGHGLGMWIVNNTVEMSGGEILDIQSRDGFKIELVIGDNI